MSIFSEVLVQSRENTYHLEKKRIEHPSAMLSEVIPEFFETHTPGLHTAVICTNNSYDVISELEFLNVLKKASPDRAVIKRLTGASGESRLSIKESCGCARPECDLSIQIGGALQYIEDCTVKFVGEELLDLNARAEINRYSRKERDETVRIEEIWMKWEAKECSNLLPQDIFARLGYMPSIFVLYVLPESCFGVFKHQNAFFPKFIEYVVLGEDSEQFHKKQQEKDQNVIDMSKNSPIIGREQHKVPESHEVFEQQVIEGFQFNQLEISIVDLHQKIQEIKKIMETLKEQQVHQFSDPIKKSSKRRRGGQE